MSRRRSKLTRADFQEYRGYFFRPATPGNSRTRLYAPQGYLVCELPRDGLERHVDQDIESQAAKAAGRPKSSAAGLLRRLRGTP